MADYDYQTGKDSESVDYQKVAPQDETMHPALQAFRDAIPPEVGAEGWVSDVTTRLNNFMRRRDIADGNAAAGQEYVRNMSDFKDGLKGMVQADPTAIDVALDIVPHTIHALMPDGHPDAMYGDTHESLTKHIQSEIASSAVTAMAERNAAGARAMLGNPRVDAILGGDEKRGLDGYITAQTLARGADHNAQTILLRQQQSMAEAAAGHAHASALVNPDSNKVEPPNGWAQKLIADPRVAPDDKGSLMNMYGRLQTTGDAIESHGPTVRDALNQMKAGTLSSGDLWNAVGPSGGLTMQDAQWLNGLMHTTTKDGIAEREAFTDTLNRAAEKFLGKDGSGGAEGRRNFNNFAKWYVEAYRGAGAGSLHPDSDSYLFKNAGLNSFADASPVSAMRGGGVVNNGVPEGYTKGRDGRYSPPHVSSYFNSSTSGASRSSGSRGGGSRRR